MAYEIQESEKKPTHLLMKAETIRKMIAENPELPLIFIVTEEANNGDYSSVFTDCVHAEIGEFLDCCQEINNEICFTDRDKFEEEIFDNIEVLTGYDDRSEEWYAQEAERIASLYDPYWKKCIIIQVGD